MDFKINPFNDAGITSYEQFKLYPFLLFGSCSEIYNSLNQQIKQIENNYFFGDRIIILGERGIGKSSTLFFIKEMLEDNKINYVMFSRLFDNEKFILDCFNMDLLKKLGEKRFEVFRAKEFRDLTEKPLYLLVDFPDTLETKNFKKFLEYLWDLMTHPNYNKINMIFAMNISHHEKSYSYSEIFGKFQRIRLERLNIEETEKLISSRLKKINKETPEVFDKESIETIFSYSKGIPRNIISACKLLVDNSNGLKIIDSKFSQMILNERYFEQVINDRVTDLELKLIYKKMVDILEHEFNGNATSQEDFIKKVIETTNIGRNSLRQRIDDLEKFGIFKRYRGGYNRLNRIISFN